MSTHEILAVLTEQHAAIAAGDAPLHMDGSFRAAVELAPGAVV